MRIILTGTHFQAKKIIEKKISDSKQQVGVIPVAPVKPTDFAAYRERMTVPKEKRGVVFGKGGETLNTLMRTTSMKPFLLGTLINLSLRHKDLCTSCF